MKVCFFGIGSIGTKHIENLKFLCRTKSIKLTVHAYRTGKSNYNTDIDALVDKQIYNRSELDSWYDAVFICNPTSLHYQTVIDTRNLSDCFFIEKPIFDKHYDLNTMELNSAARYYVACPLRYKGVIQYLKEHINKYDVISGRIICSSYLPNWRPGTDYTKSYSAIKALGGGVSIDLVHEIDYMTYLFGLPDGVLWMNGKYSNLKIDSDDLSCYIFQYANKLIEMHLDYFGLKPQRKIELFCNDQFVVGDLLKNSITIQSGSETEIFTCNENANDFYLAEMQNFLNLVYGEKYISNNLYDAQRILVLAKGEIE